MATPARSRRPPGGSPPEKRTRNPLYSNILPITPLFLIFCGRNDAYLHENKDLRQGGGGTTLL